MNNIDKVAWIYIHDRKVLGAQSQGKVPFYIPGGKREEGEDDIATLLREVKEELNVTIIPETAKFINHFQAQAHGKPEGVMVVMHCYTAEFIGELTPSSEIAAIDWLTSQDIETEKTAPVDKIILAYLKSTGEID